MNFKAKVSLLANAVNSVKDKKPNKENIKLINKHLEFLNFKIVKKTK